MDAVTRTGKRKRRWLRWLLWAVVVWACLGGWIGVVKSATFPRAVADHPIRTEATVTQNYSGGPGGDPGVEYEYRVGSRMFKGSGDGRLDATSTPLEPGDKVTIEYAADAPSESCTCDAAREVPSSLRASILLAAALTLPFVALLWRTVPRLARTRKSWFAPVRGWEWVPFVAGILLALAFGALALAYFYGFSVEGWSG